MSVELEKQLREARAVALEHLAWCLKYESRLSMNPRNLARGARLAEHWASAIREGRL